MSTHKVDSIDDVIAGLATAIRVASQEKPELVGLIAPALEMLSQTQVGLSALSSRKQRTLEEMALLEAQLAACDPGKRATYIMDRLDLPRSTYYDYRALLEAKGLVSPDESELSGLAEEDDLLDR
jgi:hypothetical protein